VRFATKRVLLFLVPIAVIVTFVALAPDEPHAIASKQYEITFQEPMDVASAMEWADSLGLSIVELSSTHDDGTEVITAIYPVSRGCAVGVSKTA
jgi:hypothetical protein